MPVLTDTHGQLIEFDIPEQYKKIAVNVSGGADSAILLYMVADYLQQHNRTDTKVDVLSCGNDKKHRWNPRKAADVINFVTDKLNFTQIDMHYSYYRDVQDVKYFHEVEGKLAREGKVDLFISGITANPAGDNTTVSDNDGNVVDLKADALAIRNVKDVPILKKNPVVHFYTPFINVDKRFVAAMYEQYGVRDNLFPLTRSCEAIPDPDKGYQAEFEKTPCGTCWWCLERKWAFGEF